jgi:site-specific recombinase XerD
MSALRRALATAGIGKPGITLHKLRHSFACMLLQNGCDLFSLSTMLGHTRLDTTAIYLEATVEHLRTAIGRHPLARNAPPPAPE